MTPSSELREAAKRIRNVANSAHGIAQVFEAQARQWDQMDMQNSREGVRTRVLPNDLDLLVLEAARALNGGVS